jgi:hypothetical protein
MCATATDAVGLRRYYVVPVKNTDRASITASTCECHTLCPSTAIVISRNRKMNVAQDNGSP